MSSEKSKIEEPITPKPLNMGVGEDSTDVVISVDTLAAGGRGVGREDGRVWFVRGALPGDRVLARPERVRKRFVEGRAVSLEDPSVDRREPPCPHQGSCGGCPWMPLPEPLQRQWKHRIVIDALERIAGGSGDCVEAVRSVSSDLGYRNRVEFSIGAGSGGDPAIGLWGHVRGERALVDLPACPLQTHGANELLSRVREFAAAHPEAAREWADLGPFRLLIRESSAGQRLVGLWGSEHPFPVAEALAQHLCEADPAPHSVVELRSRPGRRGGIRSRLLCGEPAVDERIGKFEFRLPPASFVQVNPDGAVALVNLVLELAGEVKGAAVLDLFGGVGAFGLHLAGRGAGRTIVCDADRDAIEAGRRGARNAGAAQVRFAHARVNGFLASVSGEPWDVVVANPPRTGFGRGVGRRILRIAPRRLVVISCDPPTLARDLRPFLDGGYRLDRVVPVDLFPQTHHIETVARLTREKD